MNNSRKKQILIGCGILEKEINWLIKENNWQINTSFLDSSLHSDFERLYKILALEVGKYTDQETFVFYGSCHPLIDKILHKTNLTRSKGQNCVEMLLGHSLFIEELSKGAYFLLEDWALRWDVVVKKTFGDNIEIARQIFQEDRKYLLGINTPCSSSFINEAEYVAQSIGLPLRWMDIQLDNLKSVLIDLMNNNQSHGR